MKDVTLVTMCVERSVEAVITLSRMSWKLTWRLVVGLTQRKEDMGPVKAQSGK